MKMEKNGYLSSDLGRVSLLFLIVPFFCSDVRLYLYIENYGLRDEFEGNCGF
jgi:hypothetical protein